MHSPITPAEHQAAVERIDRRRRRVDAGRVCMANALVATGQA